MRHILSVADLSRDELARVLDRSAEWKTGKAVSRLSRAPSVTFLLERPTFRTRIAYEGALMNLGGRLLTFEGQLDARESIADVGRVLSEMVDAVLVRVGAHETIEALADASTVPVVNALTRREHPVEVLADAMTMREVFGDVKVVAVYEKGQLVLGTEDPHRSLIIPAADWEPSKKGKKQ